MENKITYHEQNDIDNVLKLREVLKTLPPFCRDYFRAIDATTTTKNEIKRMFAFLAKFVQAKYIGFRLKQKNRRRKNKR